jgi:hypothetical protein
MAVIIFLFFCISPLLSFPLIILGLFINRKNFRLYIVLAALSLAILGYYFEPNPTMDLYRHFSRMESLRTLSLLELIQLENNALFIQNIIFYLVGKTNNFNLLPVLSIFFTYWNIFYILFDLADKEKVKSSNVFLILICILFSFPFVNSISGIRYYWAGTTILLAFYRETVQNKKNILTFMLYFVPCFMHSAVILFVIFRIILFIYHKPYTKVINLILLVWTIFSTIINGILIKLSNSQYFNELNYSFNSYSNLEINNLFHLLERFYFTSLSVFYLILINIIYKYQNDIWKKYKFQFQYIQIAALFGIGSIPIFYIAQRINIMVTIMSLAFIVLLGMKYLNRKHKVVIYFITFFIFSLSGLYQYSTIKGAVINFNISLTEMLLKNYLTVFF